MAEYIDKSALEAKLNERYDFLLKENGPYDHYTDGYEEAVSTVEDFPAADVAPVVHGRWIGEGDGYADGELVFDVWHCSECDYCIDDGTDDAERLPKYCPDCGAKMDERCSDD